MKRFSLLNANQEESTAAWGGVQPVCPTSPNLPCEVDDDDDGDNERLSGSRCLLSLYLLGQALRVLQAVREGLDQEVAAALTQSAVVLALLAGVGEESQPHLRHRVAAGLLSEHVRGGGRSDRVKLNVGCWLFWGFFFYLLSLEVNLSASLSSDRAYSLSISPRLRR